MSNNMSNNMFNSMSKNIPKCSLEQIHCLIMICPICKKCKIICTICTICNHDHDFDMSNMPRPARHCPLWWWSCRTVGTLRRGYHFSVPVYNLLEHFQSRFQMWTFHFALNASLSFSILVGFWLGTVDSDSDMMIELESEMFKFGIALLQRLLVIE